MRRKQTPIKSNNSVETRSRRSSHDPAESVLLLSESASLKRPFASSPSERPPPLLSFSRRRLLSRERSSSELSLFGFLFWPAPVSRKKATRDLHSVSRWTAEDAVRAIEAHPNFTCVFPRPTGRTAVRRREARRHVIRSLRRIGWDSSQRPPRSIVGETE